MVAWVFFVLFFLSGDSWGRRVGQTWLLTCVVLLQTLKGAFGDFIDVSHAVLSVLHIKLLGFQPKIHDNYFFFHLAET